MHMGDGLLLAIWPSPALYWFTVIGLSLAAIHAVPLLARLWQSPPSLQRTLELCALGWQQADRRADSRFASLTAACAALLALATLLVVPHWLAPLGIAAVSTAMLFFGKAASHHRTERIAAAFAAASLPALIATMPLLAEMPRPLTGGNEVISSHLVIRWTGLATLFALFAARAASRAVQPPVGQGWRIAIAAFLPNHRLFWQSRAILVVSGQLLRQTKSHYCCVRYGRNL
jgi:hypothetical protein